MPASAVTVTASFTSGLGMRLQRVGDHEEARQRGDDARRSRIPTRCSSTPARRPPTAALVPSAKLRASPASRRRRAPSGCRPAAPLRPPRSRRPWRLPASPARHRRRTAGTNAWRRAVPAAESATVNSLFVDADQRPAAAIAISGCGELLAVERLRLVERGRCRSLRPRAARARRRQSRYSKPDDEDEHARRSVPSHGAAQAVVLKNVVGMMFWICGVPGSASMVKVNAPSAMVPGSAAWGCRSGGTSRRRTDRPRTPPRTATRRRRSAARRPARSTASRACVPTQPDDRGDDRLARSPTARSPCRTPRRAGRPGSRA